MNNEDGLVYFDLCIYVSSMFKRQNIIAAIAVTGATVATFTFNIHSVTSTSASSIYYVPFRLLISASIYLLKIPKHLHGVRRTATISQF